MTSCIIASLLYSYSTPTNYIFTLIYSILKTDSSVLQFYVPRQRKRKYYFSHLPSQLVKVNIKRAGTSSCGIALYLEPLKNSTYVTKGDLLNQKHPPMNRLNVHIIPFYLHYRLAFPQLGVVDRYYHNAWTYFKPIMTIHMGPRYFQEVIRHNR